MMRQSFLRRFTLCAVVALLSAACSGTGGGSSETSQASSTTAVTKSALPSTTTSPEAPTTSAPEPTPTTIEMTTTTVDPALLPDPAAMEQLVRDYCSSWPDVTRYLAENIEFADIPADGWIPAGVPREAGYVKETDEAVARGPSEVEAALAMTGFSTIDCGDPTVVSADWIAVPVSASRLDGSGEEGIWMFRIVDDKFQWQLIYGTDVDEVAAVSTEPDPVIASEARSFCTLFEGTFEGTGYQRDVQAIVDSMSDDPATHGIPHNLHNIGVSGVKSDVFWYPPAVIFTCGEITTNGRWSAVATMFVEPAVDLALIGFAVQHHVDGKIHRQYNQYTQVSGSGNWGLPLEE